MVVFAVISACYMDGVFRLSVIYNILVTLIDGWIMEITHLKFKELFLSVATHFLRRPHYAFHTVGISH